MARQPDQDIPPQGSEPTAYDKAHFRHYLRLLDAHADGADHREAIEIIFGTDSKSSQQDIDQFYEAHLERAIWLVERGFLILAGASRS